MGLSILYTSLSFCLDVAEHLDRRILDEVHSEGRLWETAGGASHFLYGQDPGFRDLYVGANFGSHQQGARLVPEQPAAQAHLDLAKSKLHDHLLSNPPFKCIVHTAHGLAPRTGSMGDSQVRQILSKVIVSVPCTAVPCAASRSDAPTIGRSISLNSTEAPD